MELTKIENNLTLLDIAQNPASYQSEVKAAALSQIKQIESQLWEIKKSIQQNVISEMTAENATKIVFKDVSGDDRVLTLKSAPKKLNSAIKNYEEFLISKGFPNLLETKIVPLGWGACKEIRKQGNSIQEVIDMLYVEGLPSIDIK